VNSAAVTTDVPALTPLQKLGLAAEIIATYPRVRWLMWRRDLPETVATLRRFPDRREPAGGAGTHRTYGSDTKHPGLGAFRAA